MEGNSLISRAARHVLSQFLGHDEGIAYYCLLTNSASFLETEYSYSKKYRLLKNLFSFGALGKHKPYNQDFFKYFLMPPYFLDLDDDEIMSYLESIYVKNHSHIFSFPFSQIMVRDFSPILIFLVKNKMLDYANLSLNEINLSKKYFSSKLKLYPNKSKKELGIIDGKLGFEFHKVSSLKGFDFIGNLVNLSKNSPKYDSHLSRIDGEITNKLVS